LKIEKGGLIMKINEYNSFQEAIRSLTQEDEEYILVRHVLKAGEKVKEHYHPRANEWIIVNIVEGKLVIWLGDKMKKIDFSDYLSPVAIFLPAGVKHSLLAISPISYSVLRDRKDKTIYCKKESKT